MGLARLKQTADNLIDTRTKIEEISRVDFPTPQPGPQTDFVNSLAKICIYGGAAGGGKTAGCLIDSVKYLHIPNYGAVFFRRTYPEIFNQGGLWDNASEWYPILGGKSSIPVWRFPKQCKISFKHLQHEKDATTWLGAQIPRLYFDQVETFTENQFWRLYGRCRTTLDIRTEVRATCNPDPESFIAKLIDWWIGDDGYPLYDRAGKLRWFLRHRDEILWRDDPDDLATYASKHQIKGEPASFTFIPATIEDNQKLMEADPDYVSNLEAQHEIDRQRLLLGNWKIKPEAGKVFNRSWFDIIDHLPSECYSKKAKLIRFWDLAATKTQLSFFTAGVKLLKTKMDGAEHWFVLDAIAEQINPAEVFRLIRQTAQQDGVECAVGWEQEPGSAGVMVADQMKRNLPEFKAQSYKPNGDKVQRALPFANLASHGFVHLLRGEWCDRYIGALHNFDGSAKPLVNDLTDASSGGYHALRTKVQAWSAFDVK